MTESTRVNRLTAIIPAAGKSSRMGRFKPLLPWPPGTQSASTVITSTIQSVRNACLLCNNSDWRIIVVCGYRFSEIASVVTASFPDVRIVENSNPDAPMSSSVALAMGNVLEHSHVLVLPGDHPAVRFETIRSLFEAIQLDESAIHVPVFNGRRGHPILFPSGMHDRLKNPDAAQGLRAILHDPRVRVIEWPTEDPGIILNLDYPEDYK